jgi:hypothetical protein
MNRLPTNPEGDWWELWDEKNNLPYYYHTRANISNWVRPTDANIISLVKIQVGFFFFNFFYFTYLIISPQKNFQVKCLC